MPRPTPTPKKRASHPPRSSTPASPSAIKSVDPRWLLKAGAISFLVALFCGYLTLCLLFYQGQWQLVLHPTRTSSSQSPVAGAPSESVHFAPDESAVPQLTGWWIPAAPSSRYSQIIFLFLPGADGSLADSSLLLSTLHGIGINIFAFDYRGYGQSAATHPTQQNMIQDTESAWRYLQDSRKIPANHIVPYGLGVGASLAARLATTHPEIPALILESDRPSPQTDLLDTALHDPRTHLLPARWLFHEDFPLATPLSALPTPKLLLSLQTSATAFKSAAEPRTTVEFETAPAAVYNQPSFTQAILRFLDQYCPPTRIPDFTIPAASH